MNAGVQSLAVEPDGLVRRRDLDVDVGTECMKSRKTRNQPADSERRRYLQSQRFLIRLFAKLSCPVVDLVQRAADDAEEDCTLRRELDATGVARKQPDLKPVLQCCDVTTDRALRHVQLLRRMCKARMPRRGLE